MNIDATLEALQPRLSLAVLRQGHGEPFAMQVEQGPHLELRFIDALDALSIAVLLGHLLRSHVRESALRLLLSNLLLADAGQPHYALDPQDGVVFLCRTVPIDPASQAAALEALRGLLSAWAPARQALQDLHLIA